MKHDKIEDDIIYELASQKDLFNNNTGEISIEKFMVLRILRILPELENKILHGRIKDKETEKIRLEYYKQYVNICNSINNFTKDACYRIPIDKLKDLLDMNTNENNFNKEIKELESSIKKLTKEVEKYKNKTDEKKEKSSFNHSRFKCNWLCDRCSQSS